MDTPTQRFFGALDRASANRTKLTHNLFRYPAKFHPPIARALIDTFSAAGDRILDPFCGSGTVAVEAIVSGRTAISVDVDPVAVAVTKAKTSRLEPEALRRSVATLIQMLSPLERRPEDYERLKFYDLTVDQYNEQLSKHSVSAPLLPNLFHWFRKYVIVDLANILASINCGEISDAHATFLRVVFASVIRNSSNADPVPVSGLEVTSHMLRKEKEGRLINPFALFRRALTTGVTAASDLYAAAPSDSESLAIVGDATALPELPLADVVITSPPYHGAVDYYRRHTLEMYWLGAVENRSERLTLLDRYIGRLAVPKRLAASEVQLPESALEWERRIRSVSDSRANGFRHYAVSMKRTMDGLVPRLSSNGKAILVVGNSRWKDTELPTDHLISTLAADNYDFEGTFSYPLKNRYMSYSRKNGANIQHEHVLIFSKR